MKTLFLTVLCTATGLFGQNYSTDGIVMQQSVDSCYIILSNIIFDYNTSDIQLMKIKENGDSVIWKKYFGGSGIDCGLNMIKTSDDGFLIVGGTTSYGESNGDVFLIKTDYNGDNIWTATSGDQYENCATGAVEIQGNGYLVVGYTKTADTASTQKIYILRFNQYGDTVWTKKLTNSHNAYATCIEKTMDGNFLIAGDEDTTGKGLNKIVAIKIDSLGNTVWHKLYGENICGANSIISNNDGSFIISGYMDSITDAKTYAYIMKLTADGDTLWSKKHSNFGYIYNGIKIESDEYLFAGETDSCGSAFAFKTNAEGDTVVKVISENPVEYYNNGFLFILNSYQNDYYFVGYSQIAWDTTCVLLVQCDNMLNIISTITLSIDSVQQQITQPTINPQLFNVTQINYGNNINYQVSITNEENILRAVLYWAPFGNLASLDSFTLTKVSDTIYQQVIPSDKVYRQGIGYKIKAYCPYGVYSQYPSYGSYHIRPVVHGQISDTICYDQWQMISVPFAGDGRYIHNLIADNFGTYDVEKWRLYEHNNNLTNYYVELKERNTGPIEYGRSYWLRQRLSDPATITMDSMRTWGPAMSTDTLRLSLNPGGTGWNDVGNPFFFSLPWDYILAASGNDPEIIGPYYYNSTRWMYPNEITHMGPWKGYVLKNTSAGTKTLKIPASVSSKNNKGIDLLSFNSLAKVTVRCNGAEALNVIGAYAGASDGRDVYDFVCPPPSLSNLSAFFVHDDWVPYDTYGYDVRKEIGEGQVWDYVIKGHGGSTTIDIETEEQNQEYGYWLVDLTENEWYGFKGGLSYRFSPQPGEKAREFKIIIGKDWYIENTRNKLRPAITSLNKVYPNPAKAGAVRINYQLSERTKVTLKVYNVNGQLVSTLVDRVQNPGYYDVSWCCRNDRGKQMSSGLYFARIRTERYEGTKRIIFFK